jgi:hypothetical protein
MSEADNGRRKDHPRSEAIDSVLLDPSAGQRELPPHFPGYEGLPFRGAPPDLKRDDPANAQPQVGATVHVDILNMADDGQRRRLESIYQLVANGYAMISAEERAYDENIGSWRIFVRWAELYTYDPSRGHQHGQTRDDSAGSQRSNREERRWSY